MYVARIRKRKREENTNPSAYRWAKVLLHVNHNQGALNIWVSHVGSVTLFVSVSRCVCRSWDKVRKESKWPPTGVVDWGSVFVDGHQAEVLYDVAWNSASLTGR